jgi:heat-inducible transcriptional repressor
MATTYETGLNERAQHLLKVLVEHYIHHGRPIGSRLLARASGLDLSAASVRNAMADLEELGFIAAPHTSAGRVPTAKGYRFFVDTLLTVKPLDEREVERLKAQLAADGPSRHMLLNSTSSLLSAVTRMAAVITLPRREHAAWRQIEFLPLSNRRVLAILVVGEREVQNRILTLERDYSAAMLKQTANYLNAQFSGKNINEIRASLLSDMRRARERMNAMMLAAIGMAEQMFRASPDDGDNADYVLAGETNLMDFAELSDVEKLKCLFEAFNRKRDILHVLDKCIAAEGVQIFIGEEAGYAVLDELSVVTAPYSVADNVAGVLGIIGPTRMAYERVIPIVEITARLLGAALNSEN